MGYLQSISLFSGQDNLGGALQLKVCRKAEIETIPAPVNGVVYSAITLKDGGAFYAWAVNAGMQSQDNNGREGPSKKNSLSFRIPKDRADLRVLLQRMENDEFVVVFTENGKQKIFGQLHAPVRFRFAHSSGSSPADLNSYDCSFYYQGPDNTFFYEPAIPAAPAGPSPAIVRFNGVAIASLAPGEIFNITSEYSYTEYFTGE